ncbi:Ig-like domain-containing protein [Butyrivibrio sp. WCD3002]|uniref:Ig-like domain-containing protein n=1 Tax=Butyrivibrio sp. WCD3002 TaxID=1280676 RepID=UPI00042879DF|nr:Ig-like domain-containing protein [Butyrivibrio sp. WCD3002]
MERKDALTKFRGRIKGLAAIGLAVAMAFGMMPAMQAKAAEDNYLRYMFVRSGDDARLYGDHVGSGDVYDCYHPNDFSGNRIIDENLNPTSGYSKWIIPQGGKDELEQTITVKEVDKDDHVPLFFGYVGKTGNFTTYQDGNKVYEFEADYTMDTSGSVWGLYFNAGESDVTLITETDHWILDVVTVSYVKSIALDKTELNFKQGDAGQKLTLSPRLNPARFNWTSSNEAVAKVDGEGTVSPVKGGTATITATMKTNSSIGATCTVNVEGKEETQEEAKEEKQEEAKATETPQALQTEEPTVDRSADTMETGLKITQNKKGLNVKWDAEADAAKYEVYAAYLGKKNADKIETTANSAQVSTIGGKNIDPKKNYEIYVVAYDAKGNKIGTSLKAFVAGKDSKNTNAKKITATRKVSIKAGKSAKVKTKITLADKKKKVLAKKYAADVRYFSTDTSIATVSKSGRIRGVAKGSCTVYAIAKNGLAAKIKVTVK